MAADASVDAVVKREVAQSKLQVVSSVQSLRLSDRLETPIKSLDELLVVALVFIRLKHLTFIDDYCYYIIISYLP